MCIDIVDICFGIANGQFSSIFDSLSYLFWNGIENLFNWPCATEQCGHHDKLQWNHLKFLLSRNKKTLKLTLGMCTVNPHFNYSTFPKDVAIKMNLLLYRILQRANPYVGKALFCSYFLTEHMFRYLLESPHWGDSNKYPKHMFFKVLNTIFLYNLWLIVTSEAKVSWQSDCYYNEFCRYIECRYKEGCLYPIYS